MGKAFYLQAGGATGLLYLLGLCASSLLIIMAAVLFSGLLLGIAAIDLAALDPTRSSRQRVGRGQPPAEKVVFPAIDESGLSPIERVIRD